MSRDVTRQVNALMEAVGLADAAANLKETAIADAAIAAALLPLVTGVLEDIHSIAESLKMLAADRSGGET